MSIFNRACEAFTRLLVVWVLAAVAVGYLFPSALLPLRPHNEWLFAFTMLGIGAVLALKHLSPQAAIPNALFATWCIITASILAEIWSKNETRR